MSRTCKQKTEASQPGWFKVPLWVEPTGKSCLVDPMDKPLLTVIKKYANQRFLSFLFVVLYGYEVRMARFCLKAL